MSSEKNDVVIIGAGPAGLETAKILAAAGKKVIVLEKSRFLGHKLCANGLTRKDLRDFPVPASIIEKEYASIQLSYGKKTVPLELDEPWLWTMNRQRFAQWQLKKAQEAGATVRLATSVVQIGKNYLKLTDGKRIDFQDLVGADGSNSLVRRFLKLKTQKIGVALQYHIPSQAARPLEVFCDLKNFGPHYAWIFPHEGYLAVGTGADSTFIPLDRLRQNFQKWCGQRGIDFEHYTLHAHPINYDYRGMVFDHIFLVGDAAGLASGLTGEGIYPALVSAGEVARKILDPGYKMEKIDQLLATKYLGEKILRYYAKSRAITALLFSLGFFWLRINKTFRRRFTCFFAER